MSKYHIDFCEEKQTKIGPILEVQVTDESGVQTDKVALFPSNWPNWKELKPGSDIVGELQIKQNGKWTNKTLYPEKTNTMSAPRAPAWAKTATAEKNKGIAIAQENKQEGIKVSSTFRDATLIAIEFLHGTTYTPDEFKKKWLEIRNWLYQQFDTNDSKENPPFN